MTEAVYIFYAALLIRALALVLIRCERCDILRPDCFLTAGRIARTRGAGGVKRKRALFLLRAQAGQWLWDTCTPYALKYEGMIGE